jgi:hypothetical protein
VFDRERKVLGWKKFDCKHLHVFHDVSSKFKSIALNPYILLLLPGYSVDSSSRLPVNPNPSAVPPKSAMGPNSYTPEAAKGSPNSTQVNVLQPSAGFSLKLHFNTNIFVAAVLLSVVIL